MRTMQRDLIDEEFKEFTDAPINMKKTVFENMEQLWHQADFSWVYQENCRKFLLKEKDYINKFKECLEIFE